MALSSRAHAFSVESLVGNSLKRTNEDTGNGQLRDGLNAAQNQPGRPKLEEHEQSAAVAEGDKISSSPSHRSLGGDSDDLQVELQGADLWKRFHEIGTEMIITKAGRRMFPAVRVRIRGLESERQYYIAMDIVPVDSKRYRYVYHSSQWMVAGNTEQSPMAPRLYVHPDSPTSGQSWMKQIISFDRVKLTNNDMDEKGHIILQSMHKYRPRIHVVVKEVDLDMSIHQFLPSNGVQTFTFPETEFTTVTAYQNQQITRLKIDRNPFAKGFRDPGRNRIGLERVMDNYPWRPTNCRSPLDFQPFNIQKPVGYPDSPLGNSSAGTLASLSSELFPMCSAPGLFHLNASSLAVTCRTPRRCSLDGPARSLGAQHFNPPASDNSPHDLLVTQRGPPLMFRFPSVSSLASSNGKSGHGLQLAPSAAFPHLQMMHPGSAVSQSHRGVYSWAARRPHTLYGYHLSAPTSPTAPLKLTSPLPENALGTERILRCGKTGQWPQPVSHCL
ncbi:T-box transcription factor TBX22-like isoform X1 [Amblyraja radiata]|uniref:T-box transcription factor TBX22-like isoform X1 n=1 Tax=Amblyraja radiata TaxID=386614 RepID=UPI001401F838|nr:T-box transcription factor TBX22-like isoform X1 [Amblyraja radiata]